LQFFDGVLYFKVLFWIECPEYDEGVTNMPIYEYRCNSCGENFEKLVFPSDDEAEFTCEACGKKDISRIVSSFSKGSAGSGFNSIAGSQSCGGSSGGFS